MKRLIVLGVGVCAVAVWGVSVGVEIVVLELKRGTGQL